MSTLLVLRRTIMSNVSALDLKPACDVEDAFTEHFQMVQSVLVVVLEVVYTEGELGVDRVRQWSEVASIFLPVFDGTVY